MTSIIPSFISLNVPSIPRDDFSPLSSSLRPVFVFVFVLVQKVPDTLGQTILRNNEIFYESSMKSSIILQW